MVKISKFIDNYIGKIICLLLPRSTDKDRTLFIQWWGMGESILTLPAIKFYAEAHPDKYIHILCSERNKEVFEGHKFIDELHIIKFNPLSMIRFIIKYFYYFQEVYDFEEYQNSSALIAYFVGREYYQDNPTSHKASKDAEKAGIYFLILFLLMPYPYTTMMRGFQEAALLFFILLIIYSSISKKVWTPIAWAIGGIVKPFALVLAPLFAKDFLNKKKIIW